MGVSARRQMDSCGVFCSEGGVVLTKIVRRPRKKGWPGRFAINLSRVYRSREHRRTRKNHFRIPACTGYSATTVLGPRSPVPNAPESRPVPHRRHVNHNGHGAHGTPRVQLPILRTCRGACPDPPDVWARNDRPTSANDSTRKYRFWKMDGCLSSNVMDGDPGWRMLVCDDACEQSKTSLLREVLTRYLG